MKVFKLLSINYLGLALMLPLSAFAQKIEPPVVEKIIIIQPEIIKSDEVEPALNETRVKRAMSKYFVLGNYSYLDLIIPGKFGVTVGAIQSAEETWEFEYFKGSFSLPLVVKNLGKMEDKRYSVIKRNYSARNSFNISYGLSYFEFNIHVGNEYLSSLNSSYSSADLIVLNALGFNLAIGNRWSFNNNFTVGVDWFSWEQPVLITNVSNAYSDHTSNQKHRDDANRVVSLLGHFPRVALIKLQLGVTF